MKLKSVFLKFLIFTTLVFSVFTLSSCFLLFTGSGDKIDENAMQFELNEEGDGYILSRVGINMVEVEIPAEYEGLPVVGIDSDAFTPNYISGCSGGFRPINPYQVIIPESIEFIGSGAFYGNEITEVIYDGTMEQWLSIELYDTPFSDKTRFLVEGEQVTSFTVPESVKKLPKYCFHGLGALKSVTFHGEVEEVDKNAFAMTGIENLELPDSVTTVGEYAFAECKNLQAATLSVNLTNIPEQMFYGCETLKSVRLKCGIENLGRLAFANCYSLEDIDLSYSPLKTISLGAFLGCSSLGVIIIPESVEVIEGNAFGGCIRLFEVYNLSSLDIRAGEENNGMAGYYAVAVYDDMSADRLVQTRGDYIFSKTDQKNYVIKYTGEEQNITLPESFDGENYVIKKHVFSQLNNLQSVTIPEAVTEIEEYAFYKCENLTKIIGGGGVKIIGESVFENCSKLNSDIPANATQIGKNAYKYCDNLKSVTIPEGVKTIDSYTFFSCSSLTFVEFPQSLEEVGYHAFEDCSSLGELTFKENCNYIGDGAFESCGVTSVKFEGVEYIDDRAFAYCTKLKTVDFGDRLQHLGFISFGYCNELEGLNLPATLEKIEKSMFSDCNNLKYISIDGNNPNYSGKGDCVVDKKSKTLLFGCSGSVIPDDGSVEIIDGYAFAYCNFTAFNIPASVKKIGQCVFFNCTELEKIYIGSGTKYFGEGMLVSCPNLTDLYYDGTKTQYSLIEKQNGRLLSEGEIITVHCNGSLPFTYKQR